MAIRREHTGGAAEADLQASINAAAMSFQVQSGQGAGYPTGGTAPFIVAIGAGTSSEEKILCASRSGDVFTVASSGRGYDNTIGVDHNVPAKVTHVLGAVEIDEANAHLMAGTGVHGRTSQLASVSDAETLINKTIAGGSNTISGITPAMLSLGANWAAALAAALDTDTATVLSAMATGWPAVLGAAPGANWPAALAAALDTDAATVLGALHSSWVTPLGAALDADAASLLANTANGWVAVLQAAPGSGWAAALAAALDADAATVLGAMGTGWPTILAAASSSLRMIQTEEDTDQTGITSSTFAAGSTNCGHSFVAPPSGIVLVSVLGDLDQTVATEYTNLSFEARQGGTVGSGTIQHAAIDNMLVMHFESIEHQASAEFLLQGLTPANTYNVRTMHKVSAGGTGNIYFRRIITIPSL